MDSAVVGGVGSASKATVQQFERVPSSAEMDPTGHVHIGWDVYRRRQADEARRWDPRYDNSMETVGYWDAVQSAASTTTPTSLRTKFPLPE